MKRLFHHTKRPTEDWDRDEALSKKYLTGIYGAIPALKPMEMLTGRTLDDE